MRFGFHLSISGGLHRAADQAAALGVDCLQIFSGNPRGWDQKPITKAEAGRFKDAAQKAGLGTVVVHAPYLLNPASPDKQLWQKSHEALARQLQRGAALGADAVVVHPGSRRDKPLAWGVERVARAVEAAFARAGTGCALWLENTAGGGGSMGGKLPVLAGMLDALSGLPVGACLDTAHAWGAGYAIDSPAGMRRFVALARRWLGLERIKLWHLNDSVSPRGSRRDQHCHLGQGRIGREGFRALICHRDLAESPAVMETPKDSRWADRRNLALARRLRRGCRGG